MIRICCLAGRLPGAVQNVLPRLRLVGYDAIELDWPQAVQSLQNAHNPVAAIRSLLEENSLVVAGVCTTPLAGIGELQLAECLTQIRREMETASALGASAVHISTGDRRRQPITSLIGGLETLLRAADELGIGINLTNAYGSRLEQIGDFELPFVRVQHPRLRVLVDAGEFHAAAVNPRDALRAFGNGVGVLRLGDRIGRKRVPLGEGESNIPAIVDKALSIPLDGWISIDPKTDDNDPYRHLATDLAYLQSLLRPS